MLQIRSHHLEAIQHHAEQTYPEECCGLLLGTQIDEAICLVEVVPVDNAWNDEAAELFQAVGCPPSEASDRRDRFAIAPETLLQVQKQARDRNLVVVGIYHSHPDHPAVPSECDRTIAWAEYSYAIASIEQGKMVALRSWRLDETEKFQEEKILKADELHP